MHLKKEIRVYDDDDAKGALSWAAVIVARKLISIQLRRKLSWISIWISDNEDSYDISCQIDTVNICENMLDVKIVR